MSGAQPKAGNIAGCVTVCAEVNEKATKTRHSQGWVDEVIADVHLLATRVKEALAAKETVSIAYDGNVVEVWEHFYDEEIHIDLKDDLHGGGDLRLVADFLSVVRGEGGSISTTSLSDSINSHLIAYAADVAMREERVVSID